MIGTGLKKLAKQYEMKVDAGIAYGLLKGYATALSEGAGYKQITISTTFPEMGQKEKLMAMTDAVNITKQYRVQRLGFHPAGIAIVFHDTIGTMKKIEAFIDWFYPLLEEVGATGGRICQECGGSVAAGQWFLVNDFALYMHESCGQKWQEELTAAEKERKESDTGSYVQGAIGAILGALLGAVVWGVVLYVGYVASLIGLLIGWLANKGYDLFHGKQGKGKIVILIFAVILGVLVGSLAPDAVVLGQMISSGEILGYTYGDIPLMIVSLLAQDSEYASGVAGNMLMGLLFAALGVFGLLKKTKQEVTGATMKKLK